MKRVLFLIITIITLSFSFLTVSSVHAATIDITKTNVKDDLESMGLYDSLLSSDKENKFISMSQYYDLNNDLKTYVYLNYIGNKKTDNLTISLSIEVADENKNVNDVFNEYDLHYINESENLVKYEILGLNNTSRSLRRFKFQSVYLSKNQQKSKVIEKIDEVFIYSGIYNDGIKVFHQEINTITITDSVVSYYCYGKDDPYMSFMKFDDIMLHNSIYTDAWYIFFNTETDFDNLVEIEISFQEFTYSSPYLLAVSKYGNPTLDEINTRIEENNEEKTFGKGIKTEIEYKDYRTIIKKPGESPVYNSGSFWDSYTPTYDTIENIMDLRNYESKDDDVFVFDKFAEKYTWGVNFLTTEKVVEGFNVGSSGNPIPAYMLKASGVTNTAIIRLIYQKGNEIKNVYVNDEVKIPYEPGDPNNPGDENEFDIEKAFEILLLALLGIAILYIFSYIKPVADFITVIFKSLFTIIWFIIKLPYTLINAIFGDDKK